MATLSLHKRVTVSVGIMVLMLFILATARRFAYPFLPVFMHDFNLSAFAATVLIAATQIPAVVGVLWGPLGDRYGYQRVMTLGILILCAGFTCFVILPSYHTLLIALFAAGLGKNIYDPNGQACANSNVARKYRGLVTGVLETGWAMSTLIGVPLVTLLIYHFSWRAPFLVLAVAALALIIVLQITLPPAPKHLVQVNLRDTYRQAFGGMLHNRAIWGLALFFVCVGFANDAIFISYSRWLDASFHMTYVAVGLGTAIIGVAELCGELTTAFIAEKVGYKRLFVLVLVLAMLVTALLTVAGVTPALAWLLLFGAFFGAEALIVTGFAFAQDFLPGQRGAILSLAFTATNIGRIFGIFCGSGFWSLGGMKLVSVASASAMGLALLALMLLSFKHKHHATEENELI